MKFFSNLNNNLKRYLMKKKWNKLESSDKLVYFLIKEIKNLSYINENNRYKPKPEFVEQVYNLVDQIEELKKIKRLDNVLEDFWQDSYFSDY